MTDPFLTPQQAADLIDRSHDFILRLCHAKKLAHFRIGKRITIKRSDFDAYIESTRVEVAEPKQTVPAMTAAQRKRLHEAAGITNFKPRKPEVQ